MMSSRVALLAPRERAKALSYCQPRKGRRCESAFALLSHQKVTKRGEGGRTVAGLGWQPQQVTAGGKGSEKRNLAPW